MIDGTKYTLHKSVEKDNPYSTKDIFINSQK